MARRNRPIKRDIGPDNRYGSVRLQKFINRMMHGGKKSIAERIMYEAIDMAEARANRPGLEVFNDAMQNVMPPVEVKPRRVGGATYQIPVEVPEYRQLALGIRWLLAAARNRPGRGMAAKLSAELVDAASGTGSAVKRREDALRMAEANRAFAHLRW
jgi:small subunit ribosomal protein S7